MNGKQNNLKEELDFICKTQYDGDMKAMMLDLLVVMGNWAEFEADGR